MPLQVEPFVAQAAMWPTAGRQILAPYDEESIIVYQAYSAPIGHLAATHSAFGGPDFSFERMSWIKPNFLWMMYRSGWGTKPGQEVTLAVRMRRSAFDALLAEAVPSAYIAALYPDAAEWRRAVQASAVRVQWDPDHDPAGAPLPRRAIQLGLRGEALRRYAREWLLDIEDISEFVCEQRKHVIAGDVTALATPRERVYPVADLAVAVRLGIGAER